MKEDKSKLFLHGETSAQRPSPSILAPGFWVLVWLLTNCHGARAHEDRWNWGYCPPPYPPDCIDTLRKNLHANSACDSAVEAYIASVFRYRACLASESERAVREANHVSRDLRCIKDSTSCRPEPNRESVPR